MSSKLNLPAIKKAIKNIYIDNLQLNNFPYDLFIKDNILYIVIELTSNVKLAPQIIEKQIIELITNEFVIENEIRIIFNKDKPLETPQKIKQRIPNIKKIILMASAKGGVGKSTTATNLALALEQQGLKVAIVDADIYGPTIPKLLGVLEKPLTEDNKMLPIEKYGIYSISIGYIVNENQAAIWRGPMVSKALYQLLLGVKWPEIDYLIIDMPPGTGDIYLSLAENFCIDGVILITTPQNIALSILKKSISFFEKTNIPILGIVENMAYYLDENQVKHYIFGANLVEKFIQETNYKLLGSIPIIPKISKFSDEGKNLGSEEEFYFYKGIIKNLNI
ncbi:MAG: Mrp/NBP35 family ATP-binding protein [Rickettsiales bacterium]